VKNNNEYIVYIDVDGSVKSQHYITSIHSIRLDGSSDGSVKSPLNLEYGAIPEMPQTLDGSTACEYHSWSQEIEKSN
jgi:hypothetical protein